MRQTVAFGKSSVDLRVKKIIACVDVFVTFSVEENINAHKWGLRAKQKW